MLNTNYQWIKYNVFNKENNHITIMMKNKKMWQNREVVLFNYDF